MVWLVASLWVVVVLSGGYLVVWLFSQLGSLLLRRAAPQDEAYDSFEIADNRGVADFSRRRSIDATHKMVEFLEPVPAPTDLAGWRESAAAPRPQVRRRLTWVPPEGWDLSRESIGSGWRSIST